jgi:5-formaminoimidazole-4-carboxamide-1-beta-D-ribofuranosyl 5'-monophosphate synthetase
MLFWADNESYIEKIETIINEFVEDSVDLIICGLTGQFCCLFYVKENLNDVCNKRSLRALVNTVINLRGPSMLGNSWVAEQLLKKDSTPWS